MEAGDDVWAGAIVGLTVDDTGLPGVLRIAPRAFGDERGYFVESWSSRLYAEAGIPDQFVQDNISKSNRGTLRGLHLQHPHGQGKLVQALVGEVFDVAVDVRLGSPTFGRWYGEYLSEENKHQLYVPPGFAHGFCVVSDQALFAYKCTEPYHPESDLSIAWDDPDIGIRWPVSAPTLSTKDRTAPRLNALRDRLPRCQS